MRERRQREREYQRELVIKAQEAQSANVAKTEFLQRMSHDIRNADQRYSWNDRGC